MDTTSHAGEHMGVSDKKWFKFSCPQCGTVETASVSDKGSTWRGASWGLLGDTGGFTVVSDGTRASEPEAVSATCKTCGTAATVAMTYALSRPAGY
jgi:hypothetical protein